MEKLFCRIKGSQNRSEVALPWKQGELTSADSQKYKMQTGAMKRRARDPAGGRVRAGEGEGRRPRRVQGGM